MGSVIDFCKLCVVCLNGYINKDKILETDDWINKKKKKKLFNSPKKLINSQKKLYNSPIKININNKNDDCEKSVKIQIDTD